MGLLGISLLVGAVVLLCFRPPTWLLLQWRNFLQPRLDPPTRRGLIEEPGESEPRSDKTEVPNAGHAIQKPEEEAKSRGLSPLREEQTSNAERDRLAMPPPPPVIRRPAAATNKDSAEDEQTTPKALASEDDGLVPSFSLSDPDSYPSAVAPGTSTLPLATAPRPAAPGLMAPPPRPAPRAPSLNPLPSRAPAPNRNLPIPNRGPAGLSLAPPPTHSSKPKKPSRQVVLTPGHSPLDWARLSSNPEADLRGLPSNSPYLKVTPSMLKQMTGRKGKDAWMGLGGRVYNITPYIPFHPGGEPELLRGAGRDGTKLFGEIHPWVNYEGMLSACLIGIMVSEEEGASAAQTSKMEEMD